MFHYPPDEEHHITQTKALFLGLLCAVWVITGLVGHDPWKPEDAHSFGLVYSILQNGDWLVPTIAGDPYMDKPPLFYITAAVFAKLFSPLFALHDGARLASGFYTALTLLFTGLAGRELFGTGRGWAAAIILIGCLGMLLISHQLATDLALLTGCAVMQYGFTLSLRRPLLAGVLIGTGVGIGFMSKGIIAPMLFLFISMAMLLFRNWRTRPFFTSLGIASLIALPWLSIWPWAVWQARRKVWHTIEYQLPLTSFIVMLITLSFVPNIKDNFALPMLLPLALLATAALTTLRRGAANALDWFGIMTFGLFSIMMWWGWAGLLLDNYAKITQWLKEYQPGFEPAVNPPAFLTAIIACFLWLVLVWRVGRSMRRAIINWAAGVTLIWLLAMTLWLPWLDSGKSYRSMVTALKHALPAQHGCLASLNVGDTQLAMLQYFGNITPLRHKKDACDLLLVQSVPMSEPMKGDIAWKKIWEGGRTGDKNELFRLYRRMGN